MAFVGRRRGEAVDMKYFHRAYMFHDNHAYRGVSGVKIKTYTSSLFFVLFKNVSAVRVGKI